MRNLKKILALVLALVMSLSLMATASAAEAAAATGDYAVAKDVLEGLDVFKGDEGGMRYDSTITRAETAALIYRIATGDVKDTQAALYTNHPFTDVGTYEQWANGYISYGYNNEIIKGNGDGTVTPNAPVTGYATLAMILRTMGYGKNHEFEGDTWEIQTAATAQAIGLLKGVTPNDQTTLGLAATRGLVAQILFNAILTETVAYNPVYPNAYQPTGTTLGAKFGLEKIEGVVTANEYASLTSDAALADGKTVLTTAAGKNYTLNVTSTLDDIGEYRYTYIIPHSGSKTSDLICTSLFGDEANKTWETTDAEKVTDSGIATDGETERFVNFGEGTTYDSSNYRIKYVLRTEMSDDADALQNAIDKYGDGNVSVMALKSNGQYTAKWPVKGNTTVAGYSYAAGDALVVEQAIAPKKTIAPFQMADIKTIFDGADAEGTDETLREFITGEVYVGTQSYKDISDTISYDEFLETYINVNENALEVKANDKGNWLKVIDNDNDGAADYVFKVVYTFAQVAKAKDGAATALDVKNIKFSDEVSGVDANWEKIGHRDDSLNQVTDQAIVCEDELVAGDIVYYAVIDGKVQAYKAPVVEAAKVDKVNRNELTVSIVDGETYTQSEVHEHIVDTTWNNGVRNMSGGVAYDLYLDRGGYMGAFVKSELGGNMVLLTDGWFMAKREGDEFAAKVYNRETGEQDDTDITANGSLFIKSLGENNQWKQLKQFTNLNDDFTWDGDTATTNRVTTTVAVLNEDGTLLPVHSDKVYTRSTKRMIDIDQVDGKYVVPTNTYADGVVYDGGSYDAYVRPTGADLIDAEHDVEIRATSETVYFYVYPDGRDLIVKEYVGYSKLPALDKTDVIEDIYAVGTLNDRYSGYHGSGDGSGETNPSNGTQYFTADIVVVEFSSAYKSSAKQVFIYDAPIVSSEITVDEVRAIDENGEDVSITIDNLRNYGKAWLNGQYTLVNPGLYYIYETSTEGVYTARMMTPVEVRDSKFRVGEVSTSYGTGSHNYLEMATWYQTYTTNPYVNTGIFDSGKRPEYVIDETICYNLDYTSTSDSRDSYGVLTKGEWEDVLNEKVDEISAKAAEWRERSDANTKWNRNRVLVLTDGSKAVYAVSFTNIATDGKTAGDIVLDGARTVWTRVLPAGPDQVMVEIINRIEEGTVSSINGNVAVLKDNETHIYTVAQTAGYTIIVVPAEGKKLAGEYFATWTTDGVEKWARAEAALNGTVTLTVNEKTDGFITLTGNKATELEYKVSAAASNVGTHLNVATEVSIQYNDVNNGNALTTLPTTADFVRLEDGAELTITPEFGYKIKSVSFNGEPQTAKDNGKYAVPGTLQLANEAPITVSVITEPVKVNCTFEIVDKNGTVVDYQTTTAEEDYNDSYSFSIISTGYTYTVELSDGTVVGPVGPFETLTVPVTYDEGVRKQADGTYALVVTVLATPDNRTSLGTETITEGAGAALGATGGDKGNSEAIIPIMTAVPAVMDPDTKITTLNLGDAHISKVFNATSFTDDTSNDAKALADWWFGTAAVDADPTKTGAAAWQGMLDFGQTAANAYTNMTKAVFVYVPYEVGGNTAYEYFVVTDDATYYTSLLVDGRVLKPIKSTGWKVDLTDIVLDLIDDFNVNP